MKGRQEWRNADQLSTLSNHRTFRSGAIYRAMNCAATRCALVIKGSQVLTDKHYAMNGGVTIINAAFSARRGLHSTAR